MSSHPFYHVIRRVTLERSKFCLFVIAATALLCSRNSTCALRAVVDFFFFHFSVPPSPPQLEVDLSPVPAGSNLTLSAGREATIRCLSRGGNPAANIKWFLGNEELPESRHNQTNSTDVGKVKTWMAVSTLTYTFNKTDHLKALRCVAIHEAYPTKSRESSVTLDIHCKSTSSHSKSLLFVCENAKIEND